MLDRGNAILGIQTVNQHKVLKKGRSWWIEVVGEGASCGEGGSRGRNKALDHHLNLQKAGE